MKNSNNTPVKNTSIINSIIASHQKTATCLVSAARHYMQAADFQRRGDNDQTIAAILKGQKEISEANEVQGECLLRPA